jgi:hypothetical protein
MSKDHMLFGLLGLGAVAVLYLLWKESQAAPDVAAEPGPPEGSQLAAYPNVSPIRAGDFIINGAGLDNNVPSNGVQLPTVHVGEDSGDCPCDAGCDSAGTPTTMQNIPDSVLKQSASDLESFEQRHVTFTQG